MQDILLVAGGGVIGALARFGMGRFIGSLHTWVFPFPTFAINLLGSMAIGYVYAHFKDHSIAIFLGIGVLGSFTTFSTFSFETMDLLRRGETWTACAYVLGSVVFCLAGVLLGDYIGR